MAALDFGKHYSGMEKELLDQYTAALTPKFGSSAREVAEEWLTEVTRESESLGSVHLTAQAYLSMVAESPELVARLEAKKKDGATEDDIRWLWDLPDVERRMIEKDDQHTILAFILEKEDQGLSKKQAIQELRKSMPMWGDPTDTTHTRGDDRLLPYELKRRVAAWMERYYANPQAFDTKLASFSTFNAMIRSEIRAGRI